MAKKKSFEQALKRLEEIVESIEEDDIALDDAVKLYKEGIELSLYCGESLNNAQQKVSELKKSADGFFYKEDFQISGEDEN